VPRTRPGSQLLAELSPVADDCRKHAPVALQKENGNRVLSLFCTSINRRFDLPRQARDKHTIIKGRKSYLDILPVPPAETLLFFQCFPYVCPEPVLV